MTSLPNTYRKQTHTADEHASKLSTLSVLLSRSVPSMRQQHSVKQRSATTSSNTLTKQELDDLLAPSLWRLWSSGRPLGYFALEPQLLNPARHDDQETMLTTLQNELLKNGRRWFTLVVDGSVYLHLRSTLSFRLRSEPLHEEMNMLKAFFELSFPVIGEGFARTQAYTSPAQLT